MSPPAVPAAPDAQHVISSTGPTAECLLDSAFYPHILDNIVRLAPPESLIALRATSKKIRHAAEPILYRHLVFRSRPEMWRVRSTNLIIIQEVEYAGANVVYYTDDMIDEDEDDDEDSDYTTPGDSPLSCEEDYYSEGSTGPVHMTDPRLALARVVDVLCERQGNRCLSTFSDELCRLRLVRVIPGPSKGPEQEMYLHLIWGEATVVRFVDVHAPRVVFEGSGRAKRMVCNILFNPTIAVDGVSFAPPSMRLGMSAVASEGVYVLFTPESPAAPDRPSRPAATQTRVLRSRIRSAMFNSFIFEFTSQLRAEESLGKPNFVLVGAETWQHDWLSPAAQTPKSGLNWDNVPPTVLREPEPEPGVDADMVQRFRWWLRECFLLILGNDEAAVAACISRMSFITMDEFAARVDDDEFLPLILSLGANDEVV